MASGKKVQDRARRLATALASFCRAQMDLPLDVVADHVECLRLTSEIMSLLSSGGQSTSTSSRAGRRPIHDRKFAKSALLDFVTRHPDGIPHQAAMVRELERRFSATGLAVPGETWLKQTVKSFEKEAAAFEVDAADTFRASPALQAVFADLSEFLRFRRARTSAIHAWERSEELQAQFASPDKLLEAAFHNELWSVQRGVNPAHSRLAVSRRKASSG